MKSEDEKSDSFENAKTVISDESPKTSAVEPSVVQAPARLTSPVGMSTSVLGAGMMLQGRYELEKELGRGGIGAVYLARDTKLHARLVVIKVLLDNPTQDAWVYKKFQQEVEALTRIEHPNIVGVLDSGELPDGKPFIVMQYVDGATLRSQIKPDGMSLERVAAMVQQIGRALSIAHSKGILHRDLKPENIMIQTLSEKEEQVKIIDFGIARVQNSQIATATATSAMVGTIAYMSPEQLAADPLDVTSDIYALGIIAYEMVTGRRPFNPDSILKLYEMQRAGVRVNPKELRPELPEAAQEVILMALAFSPEDRYQNAREFCDELAEALKGNYDVAPQSRVRAMSTRAQAPAIATRMPAGHSAGAEADRWVADEPEKRRSWASPKVLVPVALVLLVSIAGLFLLKRYMGASATAPPQPVAIAPPKLTTTEFNDEFLNLERWNVPPTGWDINTREGQGRLEIENQKQVGFPTGINYENFEMNFNLKPLNDAGAAWVLRLRDPDNYYLFYLSGPGGNYPNRFITYVVQNGKFNPSSFYSSIPFPVELKSGEQYQIDIKAEGNKITHTITPAETGEEVNLGLFSDENKTFAFGGIGFRTVGIEKFSIDDLYVRPSGMKPPQ
ncbi:MAG TPA: serine/threonine-protein kinase [Pyrinomonadaceae bacterium]